MTHLKDQLHFYYIYIQKKHAAEDVNVKLLELQTQLMDLMT